MIKRLVNNSISMKQGMTRKLEMHEYIWIELNNVKDKTSSSFEKQHYEFTKKIRYTFWNSIIYMTLSFVFIIFIIDLIQS